MHLLMGNGSVILQNVIVGGTSSSHKFLQGRLTFVLDMPISDADRDVTSEGKTHQNLAQLVIRNVDKLCAMILWDDKLDSFS